MRQVNLSDAKTHLSELVECAAAGEEIIIAKAGRPRVRLVALQSESPERRAGRARGKIRIHDDFDVLPAEFAVSFGLPTKKSRRRASTGSA